jgi:hypothetical protein
MDWNKHTTSSAPCKPTLIVTPIPRKIARYQSCLFVCNSRLRHSKEQKERKLLLSAPRGAGNIYRTRAAAGIGNEIGPLLAARALPLRCPGSAVLSCLLRDTTLANRGLRQKDRGTRVTACTTSRSKWTRSGGGGGSWPTALPPSPARSVRPKKNFASPLKWPLNCSSRATPGPGAPLYEPNRDRDERTRSLRFSRAPQRRHRRPPVGPDIMANNGHPSPFEAPEQQRRRVGQGRRGPSTKL